MISKVTDKTKVVTDELVLEHLAEQGIDKDYVEFWHDYAPRSLGKEYSPYAKFYRDLKSGKHIMVTSGLPMVKVLGKKIDVGWLYAKGKYYSKANLFSAIVEGKQVKLTVLSDQPDGTKKYEQVTYRPQLFVDSVEIVNGEQPTLLPVDPINNNYRENTLEWSYGTVCKRRIRIIEGRFRERWVFDSNPHSSIRIKHNFAGSLKLRLGYAQDAEDNPLQVSVIGDEEIVEAGEFDKAVYPVEIGASLTVYPDAGSGNTTVDGYAEDTSAAEDWTVVHDLPGDAANDTGIAMYFAYNRSSSLTNKWLRIRRALATLDVSGAAGGIVSGTVFTLYGKVNAWADQFNEVVNIYSSAPANDNAVVAGDFDSLGTTAYATGIAHDDWAENDAAPAANAFTFVTAGNNAVQSAISGDGILRLGIRGETYDAPRSAPTWASNIEDGLRAFTSDKGAGYKPQLVVTYYIPQIPVADGDLIGIGIIRKS